MDSVILGALAVVVTGPVATWLITRKLVAENEALRDHVRKLDQFLDECHDEIDALSEQNRKLREANCELIGESLKSERVIIRTLRAIKDSEPTNSATV